MIKVTALIVAGGQGLRMQLATRKQYLRLEGVPILQRTLRVFDHCQAIDDICLVIPETDHDYCLEHVVIPASLSKSCIMIAGGDERQQSVYNGLCSMNASPEDIVVIHDGVRPFISDYHIRACIESAVRYGASLLAVPVSDTLKKIDLNGYIEKTIDREMLWAAQTPQVFQYGLIKRAHDLALKNQVIATDDSSLVETIGGTVKLIPGSRKNIKITTQEDLVIAEILLKDINKIG